MKYLVFGPNGQLGNAVTTLLEGEDCISVTHKEVDITDLSAVTKIIHKYRPGVVINCSGYIHTEEVEIDPLPAFKVNSIGPIAIAQACNAIEAICVHISTDYVFDGAKKEGFSETDIPHPINVYGLSKHAGETAVIAYAEKHYLIRTSALFGPRGSSAGENFVTKRVAELQAREPIVMVNDQWTVPSYTRDVARVIHALVKTNAPYGIYHAVNDGDPATWHEFALEISCLLGIRGDIMTSETVLQNNTVRRPTYSILCDKKLSSLGIILPTWKSALRHYLETYFDITT